MSKVAAIRRKLKQEFQDSYGVNPTYLAFVARAAVETLRDYPWINGELRGDSIVTRSYVNLGFAVELADGKGLIVPGRQERRDPEPARDGQGDRGPRGPGAREEAAPRGRRRAARSRSRIPAATGPSTARR